MSGLLEAVALRGAGLLPAAGPVPVQPRPRARFEPEGFAVETREVAAAPPRAEPAVSTTARVAERPAPPDAGFIEAAVIDAGRAPAPGRAAREEGRAEDGPPVETARQPLAATVAPNLEATEKAGATSAKAPPPRMLVPAEAEPPARAPEAKTVLPARAATQPHRPPTEAEIPPLERSPIVGREHGEARAPEAVSLLAPVPQPPRGRTPAASQPPRPTISVSIGRIEVEVEPKSAPPAPPASQPVPRTRGFEGYARARHGQPR